THTHTQILTHTSCCFHCATDNLNPPLKLIHQGCDAEKTWWIFRADIESSSSSSLSADLSRCCVRGREPTCLTCTCVCTCVCAQEKAPQDGAPRSFPPPDVDRIPAGRSLSLSLSAA
ncbi:hypothetical protein ATANTOWER_026126, partial [Ataeniobius toweri]|nr:hypothetical protein [Ataeniobius toweri]